MKKTEVYNISTGQYQVLVKLARTGIGQLEDFEEFQEKALSLCVNVWSTGLEKHCETYKSLHKLSVLYNATINTLTNGSIVIRRYSSQLSSSVVCLSFTILNTFENKKGVIKILVYSSVFDILNLISVIFLCNNYIERLGAICLGCFTREFNQIVTDFP